MFKKCFVFFFCFLMITPVFAALEMQVDRQSIASDEMLTLIIVSKDHMSISPDLSPLKKDFDIAGTNQSSQFNFINGVARMEAQWQVSLMPKHSGDILIPALQVGNEKTQPQLVHVVDVKKSVSQPVSQNRDIYIEASVIPKETYIQEQFVYTLKLFFSRVIEGPYLEGPELDDAKITLNGQDIIYSIVKNGKYYKVLERSYLITPKNTGQFQIQPPIFKGYLENTGRVDLYGFATHALKPIKIVGPILQINVKPKPANFVGRWLPAKKLTLSESWEPNPLVFREGEPITRIIEVKAEGATGDQIPNLVIDASTNLNNYPQQPQRETDASGDTQVGKLIQKIVFIPTKAGKVSFPAIKVQWWNSNLKKQQIATIAPKTVTVLPALVSSSNQKAPAKNAATNKINPSVTLPVNAPVKSREYFWPVLVLALLIAWIATLWIWRRQVKMTRTKHSKKSRSLSASELESQIKEACLANDAKQARNLFLEWSVSHWKDPLLHSLSDVIHKLESDKASSLVAEIMQLEAVFYGRNKKWQGIPFWQSLQLYLQSKTSASSQNKTDPLPPLYCSGIEPQ